jgi:diguanylate cyclase (GGDEF)-like protein
MFVEGTRIPAIALLLAVLVFAGVIAALWRRIRALTAANAALSMQSVQYETAMQLTQDVVYEWNASDRRLTRASQLANIFGNAPIYDNFPESIFELKKIHPDDVERARAAIREIKDGSGRAVCDVRLLDKNDRFVWYRNSFTAIKNDAGEIVKVLGVIANINEEKLRMQFIEDSAKKDPLTKLYNKSVTEEMVSLRLSAPEIGGALFIIDIDNFKNVNDTLGHLYGDAALSEIAHTLKGLFRESDVVGRIGGDEFLVYMANNPGKNVVSAKAVKVIESVKRSYRRNEIVCDISASLGVAFFPEDGGSYPELAAHADRALYYMKKHGKNGAEFYSSIRDRSEAVRIDVPSPRREIPVDKPQKNFRENIADYMLKIFYEYDNTDKAVPVLLDFVGKAFVIGRIDVSVFSEDQQTLKCLYEWLGEGVKPNDEALKLVQAGPWQTVKEQLDEDDMIVCEDVQNGCAKFLENDTLVDRGVTSAIFGYVVEGEKRRAVVTFEYFGQKHLFTSEEKDAMKVISRMIGLFVVRTREHESLLRYMARDREKGLVQN